MKVLDEDLYELQEEIDRLLDQLLTAEGRSNRASIERKLETSRKKLIELKAK